MSNRDLFSEAKKSYARNQHKDVARRAAEFRVDSHSSFLVNFAGGPTPAFAMSYAKYRALYDFAFEKRSLLDIASIIRCEILTGQP